MKTIFKSLRGSHAHGLATEQSDRDYFSIVVPPIEAIIGLSAMKGSQHIDGYEDHRIITLREFLRSIEHGRSTELEMLWAPEHCILEITAEGQCLIAYRERLLSRRLFKPLMGFAGGQIQRAIKGNTHRFDPELGYDPKSIVHAFRSLWQMLSLKHEPILPLQVEADMAHFLTRVRATEFSVDEIIRMITAYKDQAQHEVCHWDIPDCPDRDWMENFLMSVYSRQIHKKYRPNALSS